MPPDEPPHLTLAHFLANFPSFPNPEKDLPMQNHTPKTDPPPNAPPQTPPLPISTTLPLQCPLCDRILHSIWTRDKRRCRFVFCTHCDWDLSLSFNFPTRVFQVTANDKLQIDFLHTQLHTRAAAKTITT